MKIYIFTFVSLFSVSVMAHPGHENTFFHHEVNSIFSSILAILFLSAIFLTIKKITKNAFNNIEKKG